jgi:glucose/arabinose dehydrogenase
VTGRRWRAWRAVAVILLATLVAGCGADRRSSDSLNGGTARLPTNRGSRPAATLPGGASAGSSARLNLDDARIELTPVADVDQPVAMVPRPGSPTLFVAEKAGRVRAIQVTPETDPDGTGSILYAVEDCCVLDLSGEVDGDGERGLLGLAFSTDGRKLYAYFTGLDGTIHVVEHLMEGDRARPDTRRELLTLPHGRPNHNGGQLAIGPDGFLYVGVGDGGGAGDPDGNGQDRGTLYGKILRIDPEGRGAGAYGVPPDNPYASGGGAPEVWLYGARNPWRFSFDRQTEDLWAADVGQDDVEEVNRLGAEPGGAGRGANLGWKEMEGSRRFRGGTPPADHVPPVYEYSHDDGGCGVIGGYVYRGTILADLDGTYLYGDTCLGVIRGLLTRDGAVIDEADLGATVPENTLSSFAEDNDGELYVLSLAGEVYRVDPSA